MIPSDPGRKNSFLPYFSLIFGQFWSKMVKIDLHSAKFKRPKTLREVFELFPKSSCFFSGGGGRFVRLKQKKHFTCRALFASKR